MGDIVERLRRNADDQTICGVDAGRTGQCHASYTMDEAADEIERLRAALEKIVSDELYNEAQMVVIAEAALKEVDDG